MGKAIFGIELEVPLKRGVSCNDFRNCLSEAIGRDLVHYTDSGRMVGYHSREYNAAIDLWRVSSDGSLGGFRGRGVEIVSRRRTTLEETKKAMEATRHLIDLDLLKRTTCGGHHVHIGIMHFSAIKRTFNAECELDLAKLVRTKRVKLLEIKIHEVYSYFQPVIDSLLSRSRRATTNNHYCRPVSGYYLESLNGDNQHASRRKETYLNDRNQRAPLWGNRGVVNFGKIDSYGTVEFRQHQQTYHVATVQNWVRLMHRLTSRCWVQETKNIDPRDFTLTVDGFADYLGLGQNRLRAWMRRRANHFNFSAIAEPRGEHNSNRQIGINRRHTQRFSNSIQAMSDHIERRQSLVDIIEEELNESVPSQNTTTDGYARGRLRESIILGVANHELTYRNIRNIWRNYRDEPLASMSVAYDDAQQAISVTLPSSILQSYTAQNWERLDWPEIIQTIFERFED